MAGNQVFTFDSSKTIGDLLLVAETLKRTGQRPTLRLVRSYNGCLESVAIDVEEKAPTTVAADDDLAQRGLAWTRENYPTTPREMAVTEGAES